MNGIELLARYQRDRSEDAFRDLVGAYGSLVYSVTLRRLYSPALAEEATQTVFTRLAASAPRIASEGALAAWLHRTATRVSIDLWRAESRRRTREEEAAAMHTTTDDGEPLWERIAPELDGALERLGDADRQAVLLRFFKGMSMREVGEAMGTSEVAARVRVGRALERLRGHLSSAGAACGTAALAELLSARSVQAAPASALAAVFSVCKVAEATGRTAAMGLVARLCSRALKPAPLAAAVLVGLATFGLIVGMYFRTPAKNDTGPAALENKVAVGPQKKGRVPPWRTGREDIDQLKEELREMLQYPQTSFEHPPRKLRQLLDRFGDRIPEAGPILIEALRKRDYETQRWAGSGLGYALYVLHQDKGKWPVYAETMELARPVLGPMLRSPNTADILRTQALLIYLPLDFLDPELQALGVPLSPGMVEDLVVALKAPGDVSARFDNDLIVSLSRHFQKQPGDAAGFLEPVRAMLSGGEDKDRAFAAWALAYWPGEKPRGVKEELLRELRGTNQFLCSRAAMTLGLLGQDAQDVVPDLLACCENVTPFDQDRVDFARLSACRIQPELRNQFERANDRLRAEEAGAVKMMEMKAQRWVDQAVDPANGATKESVEKVIEGHAFPQGMRAALVEQLQQTLPGVPEERRAFFAELLQAAREHKPGEVKGAGLAYPMTGLSGLGELGNLIFEAKDGISAVPSSHPYYMEEEGRLLVMNRLVDLARELVFKTGITTPIKAHFLLERFEGMGARKVTAERYSEMATALRAFDPDFCQKWRELVLRRHPELDRMIEAAGQPAR